MNTSKRHKPYVIAMLTLALLTAIQCTKSGDSDTAKPADAAPDAATLANLRHSGCHNTSDERLGKGRGDKDSISVLYANDTLHVTHHNMTVNCGIAGADGGILMSIERQGDTLLIDEAIDESLPQANCICTIDNMFSVVGLPSGAYTLIFRNWHPQPDTLTVAF